MATAKTEIIESLFDSRWTGDSMRVSRQVVTLEEVSAAIKDYNLRNPRRGLSDRNPANFFKDFIRSTRSANRNWPKTVFEGGYSGRQVTGGGVCFEYILVPAGQVVPFPEAVVPAPTSRTPTHRIETASLPLASRRLGREDEPWLIQVLVRLRVIETHLALFSSRRIVQVDHLQMSVKLAGSEIDAMFLAIEEAPDGSSREVVVTCEAKGLRDDLLEDQIIRQVQAVYKMPRIKQNVVIPMGVKALGPSRVQVVEFGIVRRDEELSLVSLDVVSEAVYEFVPAVPGVGK